MNKTRLAAIAAAAIALGVPGAAHAESTGTGTVSGEIATVLDVTAPSISFSSFGPGAVRNATGNIVVDANVPWTMKVFDNSDLDSRGKLAGPAPLSDGLDYAFTDGSGYDVTAGYATTHAVDVKAGIAEPATSPIVNGSTAADITIPVQYSTEPVYADAPGTYSMTVNYVAAATP